MKIELIFLIRFHIEHFQRRIRAFCLIGQKPHFLDDILIILQNYWAHDHFVKSTTVKMHSCFQYKWDKKV